MSMRWAIRGKAAAVGTAAVASASAASIAYPDGAIGFRAPPPLHAPPTSKQQQPPHEDSDSDSDRDSWTLVNENGEFERNLLRNKPPTTSELEEAFTGAKAIMQRQQQQNDNVHVELTPVGSPPSWSDDDSDNILELDTSNNVNWHMEAAERDLNLRRPVDSSPFLNLVWTVAQDKKFQTAMEQNPQVMELLATLRAREQAQRVALPPGQLLPSYSEATASATEVPCGSTPTPNPWAELEELLAGAMQGAASGIAASLKGLLEVCRVAWERLAHPQRKAPMPRPVATCEAVYVHMFVVSGEIQVLLNVEEAAATASSLEAEAEQQDLMQAVISYAVLVLAIVLFKRFHP